MQITAQGAAQAAMMAQEGSPEHGAAVQICIVRGIQPNSVDGPAAMRIVANMPPLPNWQLMIAEQILETQLRQMLRQA